MGKKERNARRREKYQANLLESREAARKQAESWRAASPEKKRASANKYAKANKEKNRVRSKLWYGNNLDRIREKNVFKKFGLTREQHLALLEKQDYKCCLWKICGRDVGLGSPIDHNHNTAHIRGILCKQHNVGLGFFGDAVEGLLLAVEYLRGGV